MKNEFERELNLGGSIEQARSGKYDLKAGAILKEAWQATTKNFLSFSPAIVVLLFVQFGIFYIALKLQIGNPGIILDALVDPELFTAELVSSIYVANFSYEVISAPIYAGISLMAMSHVAGLSTKVRHIGKGLQHTVPIILATLASLVLQGMVGMILPFISLYLSLAFSHSVLLICEKNITPMHSLLLSLRAVNKKLFTIFSLYFTVVLMFFIATMFYGIGLIFVLPFFFHMKGILYREMFGIRLKVVVNEDITHDDEAHHNRNDDDNYQPPRNDHDGKSSTFDA